MASLLEQFRNSTMVTEIHVKKKILGISQATRNRMRHETTTFSPACRFAVADTTHWRLSKDICAAWDSCRADLPKATWANSKTSGPNWTLQDMSEKHLRIVPAHGPGLNADIKSLEVPRRADGYLA